MTSPQPMARPTKPKQEITCNTIRFSGIHYTSLVLARRPAKRGGFVKASSDDEY
jgi:hypothetical protein